MSILDKKLYLADLSEQLDTTMTYVYVDQRNVETAYRKYA